MRNSIIIIIFSLLSTFFFGSCKKELKDKIKLEKPTIRLEKIIVINLDEICITYFKVKIENKNNKAIILLDNSLKEYSIKRLNPQKTGFYLKNIKNDSLVTLGIDNYYFYEVGAKKSGFCFIGATNLKNSFNQKDSLLLRKMISNHLLEYNGKNLNLNSIKKSNYISQSYFDEFNKSKSNYIPYIDSLSILIPNNVKIKYINNMPITKEEWDKL
jgi:hypothetical protein